MTVQRYAVWSGASRAHLDYFTVLVYYCTIMEGFSREVDSFQGRRLEECPVSSCGSKMVYPLDVVDLSPTEVHVWLRCAECDHRDDGVFSDQEVDRFAEIAYEGLVKIDEEALRCDLASMARETELFARALALDLIGPDDFGS